jgi:hypothetical protein
MRNWRWISVLAVLMLVLAACGQQGGASASASADGGESAEASASADPSAAPSEGGAGEPVQGGTLVFAGARLAASLDPSQTSGS